jgi:hypothetical protein
MEFMSSSFPLWGKKYGTGIRSVDRRVAQGASLIFLGLIMECGSSRWANIGVQGVAAHAEQIHLILIQHSLVCRTMRRMADDAAFDFGFVLINEWPLLIGVAFITDFVLAYRRAQLMAFKSTMRVVAIVAQHQPLIYPVMEWTRKLCAHVQVASVTKLGRRIPQQELSFLRVMRRMAVDAGYSALQMSGAAVVTLIVAALMAVQAARANFRGGSIFESKYLGFVATAFDVFFAWTVTGFAAMPFRAFLRIEGSCKMRR